MSQQSKTLMDCGMNVCGQCSKLRSRLRDQRVIIFPFSSSSFEHWCLFCEFPDVFQTFGTIPFAKETLNVNAKGLALNFAAYLTRFIETPSRPGALELYRIFKDISAVPLPTNLGESFLCSHDNSVFISYRIGVLFTR